MKTEKKNHTTTSIKPNVVTRFKGDKQQKFVFFYFGKTFLQRKPSEENYKYLQQQQQKQRNSKNNNNNKYHTTTRQTNNNVYLAFKRKFVNLLQKTTDTKRKQTTKSFTIMAHKYGNTHTQTFTHPQFNNR